MTQAKAEKPVQELLKIIDQQKLPKHIAIIMDGNGRWAQKQGLSRSVGHIAGVDSLRDIVNICSELKIQILTVYGFSTENWKRPQKEINIIMNLVVKYLNKEIDDFCKKGVVLNPIGRLTELPRLTQEALTMAVHKSRDNDGLILNLALNYGGRSEITDAMRDIAFAIEKGKLKANQISDQIVADHLYNAGQPDPDLLIRPAGDARISNFLLWQLAYAEIWFTDVLWPDFRRQHLLRALVDYQHRERRFGGLNEQGTRGQ